MTATATTAELTTMGGLNIPGTFEVIDGRGYVLATYTGAYFKDAEAHMDRLIAADAEGGYTWHRVLGETEATR